MRIIHKASLFIICLLCLTLLLTSCISFLLPEPSKYDETFYDDYFVEDCNLIYLNVNDWEETIFGEDYVNSKGEERSHYWDRLDIASIPETDEKLFVVGKRRIFPFLPGSGLHEELFVYQSKDAPIPRKEWTISEIIIVPGRFGVDHTLQTHETCFRDYVESPNACYSWLEKGADAVLAEELQLSLNSELIQGSEKKCVKTKILKEDDRFWDYGLLIITFKENPNIAWLATIYDAPDGYYLGRIESGRAQPTCLEKINTFYKFSDSWNLILEEIFHGMEKYEEETESSSTSQP